MHNKILIDAFEKARKTTKSDKLTHLSIHLSDFIFEDSREPYGEKILRINYKKIENNHNTKIHLKKHVLEALSHYLGYENYSEYLIKNEPPSIDRKRRNRRKYLKLIGVFALAILLIMFIVKKSNQPRWMEWQIDHYVEVNFDSKKLSNGTLKLYKEERIVSFRKISPTCNTLFFTADGNENLWYGKNNQGALEFYTSLGMHPETGKTLKRISEHMITKYICPSYKK